ncbi:MAG: hypothetical protein QXS41_00275 [Candidatus Woesearchaeota archaeon]
MSNIVLDSGPIISLTSSNLLFILKEFHEKMDVNFIIPESVKFEVVDRAFQNKVYITEALEVLKYVNDEIIQVEKHENIRILMELILTLSNNLFYSEDKPIQILHEGEAEVFALSLYKNVNVLVIDEVPARMLIEDIEGLKNHLENKLHSKIRINEENKQIIEEKFKDRFCIRSSELVVYAYELGFFNDYKQLNYDPYFNAENKEALLLEGLLWLLKKNGCSITEEEIYQIINYELKQK